MINRYVIGCQIELKTGRKGPGSRRQAKKRRKSAKAVDRENVRIAAEGKKREEENREIREKIYRLKEKADKLSCKILKLGDTIDGRYEKMVMSRSSQMEILDVHIY